MDDLLTSYETGLSSLLKRFGRGHPRYSEVLVLESRLLENLARVRLYGDTETNRTERTRIVEALNRLALETLGQDLAGLASQGSRSVGLEADVRGSAGVRADLSVVGVDHHQRELEEVRRSGNRAAEARALSNLGSAYAAQGNFHLAAEYYKRAVSIARELGDRQLRGIYLRELGLALLRLENPSAAIERLKEALRLFEAVAEVDPLLRARTRYHLGRCQAKLGRWDEAISVLEQARETFTRHKARPELAHALLELGQIYGQMRDFESADVYLKDALRLFRRLGDTDGVAVTQEALGNLALQSARPSEAIEALEMARRGYEAVGRRERVRAVDEMLTMARQARQVSGRIGATP